MVELWCAFVPLLRWTFNNATWFHIGAEIVVTSKRIEAVKRRKTPILRTEMLEKGLGDFAFLLTSEFC
jgi:hypothetical protein